MVNYKEWKEHSGINEAQDAFYGDYFNEFCLISISLSILNHTEKRKDANDNLKKDMITGEKRIVPRRIKRFFERYLDIKTTDLSKDILGKINDLENIIENLNEIQSHKNQYGELELIRKLYNDAVNIIHDGERKDALK